MGMKHSLWKVVNLPRSTIYDHALKNEALQHAKCSREASTAGTILTGRRDTSSPGRRLH